MTRAFLSDPDNAKAYQTLCDNPRGSTRAWADKAGWTHSRMRTFLIHLEKFELGKVEILPRGSLFIPTVRQRATVCETVRRRAAPDVLDVKSNCLDVSRSGEPPGQKERQPIADPDGARLIAAMNAGFARRKEAAWRPILEDNYGSLAAAAKILAKVPVDRAVPLVEEACVRFNPSHSGGEWPRSLGHPFFYKYVAGAWRASQKDLESGQLNMLFVESGPRYQEYVAPAADQPKAKSETIDTVAEDWRAIANSPTPPRRV